MKKASQFARQFFDMVHQFEQFDRVARRFGTETVLSLAEIHLIDYIGDHEGCCGNDVAEGLGISKGAVSQTLQNLLKLNLVARKPDEKNKSRLLLSLTLSGQTAYREHKKFHARIDRHLASLLSDFTDNDYEKILNLLKQLQYFFK